MEEKELLDVESAAEVAIADEKKDLVAEETQGVQAVEEAKEGKKPMSKKRKILNGIFLGLQIVMVVLAIMITLIVILNPKTDEVSSAGIKLLPVLSESMEGSTEIDGKTYKGFSKGALVVAKTPKNGGEGLQVGDIVTFSMLIEQSNTVELVTHRIVEVVTIEEGLVKYRTQGDNNPIPDSTLKLPPDIKAVYSFHINGVGYLMTWVRDGYHFIYVIIIPLALLLIYNIFLVAQIVIEGKMKKAKAVAAENAKQAALASIDEEEIKRRAIEEYLKSQAAVAGGGTSERKGDTE